MIVKWSEMAWWLVQDGEMPMYLGEAGNSSYHTEDQISAMRIGEDVLIQFPRHREKAKKCQIVPASFLIKGFGEDKDGKTFAELMVEGVHYNYALNPMKE